MSAISRVGSQVLCRIAICDPYTLPFSRSAPFIIIIIIIMRVLLTSSSSRLTLSVAAATMPPWYCLFTLVRWGIGHCPHPLSTELLDLLFFFDPPILLHCDCRPHPCRCRFRPISKQMVYSLGHSRFTAVSDSILHHTWRKPSEQFEQFVTGGRRGPPEQSLEGSDILSKERGLSRVKGIKGILR